MVSTELVDVKSRCLIGGQEGVAADKTRNEYLESHSELRLDLTFNFVNFAERSDQKITFTEKPAILSLSSLIYI